MGEGENKTKFFISAHIYTRAQRNSPAKHRQDTGKPVEDRYSVHSAITRLVRIIFFTDYNGTASPDKC